MAKYRISISFDEKNFFYIVVDNGKFIRNPTKEDLMGTKLKYYSETNICPRCREENNITDRRSILYPGNACRQKYNNNDTKNWICAGHYHTDSEKYDPNSFNNIIKSLRDCRTGNDNPNSTQTKGKKSQKLACILYGWEDLNEKYDNHKSPIDCYDPKTGLYHQIKGRYYDSKYRGWYFRDFEREWKKIFEDMIGFCISEDGNSVERIYKFPWKEIMRVKSISVCKNAICEWYKQYRVKDEDELKKANEIWKKIIKS